MRYNNTGARLDSLKYYYLAGKNQLEYVKDTVATTAYPGDLESQYANNYAYDASGYNTKDSRASIGANGIAWTADGKLKSVTKTTPSTSTFSYDALRNRVVKRVQTSTTDVSTYYVRDAQGNIMATYEKSGTTLVWKEAHLYGSARLGMQLPDLQVRPRPATNPNQTNISSQAQLKEGWKRYELANHLRNILSVITDRKFNRESGTPNGTTDYYDPEIIAAQDYYAFGMTMPGRTYQPGTAEYRFGFNGKEYDDEIKGDDNQQDYGMRHYDPRIGRFLSVDPIAREYPMLTPYQFASNTPIKYVDIDGLEAGEPGNNSSEAARKIMKIPSDKEIEKKADEGPISVFIAPKNRSKPNGATDWGLAPSRFQMVYMSRWKVIEVEDIKDALQQLEKITESGKRNVESLIIDSHGVYADPQFKIGSTVITEGTGENLEKIGNFLSNDAKVCLLACHAGGGHDENNSEELLINLSRTLDATIYGSKSWTSSLQVLFGNPSQRNPERRVGEQPNADDNVGLWRKVDKGSNAIQTLDGLDITILGNIHEGNVVTDPAPQKKDKQ